MAKSISKSLVHETCRAFLMKKIESLSTELEAVRESAIAETKSSMGDKYETGREMMMQERNRLGKQLDLLNDQLAALDAIDSDKRHSNVKHGCLVFTEKSVFFLSAAIGQVNVEGLQVFAISGEAPIAKAMNGKAKGERFTFNSQTQIVKSIE